MGTQDFPLAQNVPHSTFPNHHRLWDTTATTHNRFLLFANGIIIFFSRSSFFIHSFIHSFDDRTQLQFGTDSIQSWCTANFITRNVSKTGQITFSKKRNTLFFKHRFGGSYITRYRLCYGNAVLINSK